MMWVKNFSLVSTSKIEKRFAENSQRRNGMIVSVMNPVLILIIFLRKDPMLQEEATKYVF